jgi:hypothetical protein
MWTRQIVRLGSTLGVVAALTVAAAPPAHAQDRDPGHQAGSVYAQRGDQDRGGADRGSGQQGRGPDRGDQGRDGNDRDDNRGDRDRGQPQAPVYVVPPPIYIAPQQPDYPPPVVIQPVPVPVTPDVQAYVLPPLEALFPTADFADYPPQLVPLGNNVFALSSPSLFWGPGQAGIPQSIAAQLAQSSQGWGTTVLNGPQGYGVYLTYQPYF